MNYAKNRSLVEKTFVVVSSLILAMGLGIASSSAALADENHHRDHHEDRHRDHHEDREGREFVSIGGNTYFVRHDGSGPYIRVDDVKYYLDGNTVTVKGKRYDVQRRDHEEHREDRHRDREHHRD